LSFALNVGSDKIEAGSKMPLRFDDLSYGVVESDFLGLMMVGFTFIGSAY